MDRVFLIGECGINSNGDVEIAKKLITLAKSMDWDCVKFQKRTISEVIPKEMWHIKKDTPWGIMEYYDYKEKLEFGKDDYDEIALFCKKMEMDWFASAWDLASLSFLEQYDLPYNKIASAMITNKKFIEEVAKQHKKTFISTGMCSWEDIDYAVEVFTSHECPYVLMHCVGLYPCPVEKLNLNVINSLKKRYGGEVGYSGHSEGAMDAVIAYLLGARYIEKHITINRAMFGSDQSASLEPAGMAFISKHCGHIPEMLGTGNKIYDDDEMKIARKLRYWEK